METYFASGRWARIAAVAVVGASLLALVLTVTATLPPPGYAVDPATGVPTAAIMPGYLRLLTPFMNITGAFSLGFGALFSVYVFMPKKRVLAYSLDPGQKGDVFLFNLLISPVAFVVNFVASIPGAVRAARAGRMTSRVPATILIAIGAWIPAVTDSLNRFGSTQLYGLGQAARGHVPLRRLPREHRRLLGVPRPVHGHRPAPAARLSRSPTTQAREPGPRRSPRLTRDPRASPRADAGSSRVAGG